MLKTVLAVRMFAFSAPVLFLLWLVFVGTFAAPEMLIGAGACLLAALALCIVERAEPAHFRPRLRDVAQLLYVPWLLAQGTFEILHVSLRDVFGGRKAISAFRIVRFAAGERRNPADTGRRVLAVVGTTMAPNFVILGINSDGDDLLFHQIERSRVPQITKNLGAQA